MDRSICGGGEKDPSERFDGFCGRRGPVRVDFMGRMAGAASVLAAAAVVLLLWTAAAWAHDHWIYPGGFRPEAGEETAFNLCSGHDFPESSFSLGDAVVSSVFIKGSGGGRVSLETERRGATRRGIFPVAEEGIYILGAILKRPGAEKPSYEARALIITGRAEDDPALYPTGEGLEIVPEKAVTSVGPGTVLPVSLYLDGLRVKGRLSVDPPGGEPFSIEMPGDGPAIVKIGPAGAYLLSAGIEGRGCSLVFEVAARKGDKGRRNERSGS